MPVGNFDQQRRVMMEPDIINDFRKLLAEFLRQENDGDVLVRDGRFQSLPEFLPLMNDDAFDTRQPHAGQCIDIITDQKHFHTVNPAGR